MEPLVLVGVYSAVLAYLWLRDRREAARRKAAWGGETPIAAVTDGARVRIAGRAVARGPLRLSPVSRRECIGFRLTVDCYDGREGRGRRRVINWVEFDSFVIADATGEAVLHAPFALRLDPQNQQWEEPPAELFELLEREGVPLGNPFGSSYFQWVEIILAPGDEITALGRATIELDPGGRAPSHRDPPIACHLKGIDGRVVLAEVDHDVNR